LLPVLPVLVRDQQADGTTHRDAATDTGENLRAVGLDRHTPATAVAALTAPHLRGDSVEIDGEAGGHAVQHRHERLAVRLASGEKSEHDPIDSIRSFCNLQTLAPGRHTRDLTREIPKVTHPPRPAGFARARRRVRGAMP